MPGLRPGMTIAPLLLLLALPAAAQDIARMAPFLDVQGIVEGDVTLAGGRVKVEAEIAGDMVLAGAEIGVGAATRVARNAFVLGDAVAMGGQYAQRVWVVANEAVLDLRSTGDVSVASARAVVGPNARIGGRLRVWSAAAPEIHPSAVIAGGVSYEFGGAANAIEALLGFVGTVIRWAFNLSLAAAALALGAWAPGFLAATAERVAHQPWPTLAWGLALGAGVPLLSLFAAITLVGLPFAGALLLAFALALALGYIVTVAYVGGAGLKLVRRAADPSLIWRLAAMAFGLVVLAGLGHIPVVGTPVLAAAYVFGLGALARETYARLK